MASVATFWWTREDEAEFLSYLDTSGPVIAYTAPWKAKSQDVVAWDIRALVATQHPGRLMFGLRGRQELIPIISHEFPKSGVLFNVEATSGCVLTYDPVSYRDAKLCRCNLAAYWSIFDPRGGTNTVKDAEFVRWGKRVFAWVRSRTKGKMGFYGISERAKIGIDKKSIVLGGY